jgi:hypothetical protein
VAAAVVVGLGLGAGGAALAQPLVGPSNATLIYNPVALHARLTPEQAIPPSGGSGTGDCIAFIDRYWTQAQLICTTTGGRMVDRLDFWLGAPSTTGFAFFNASSTSGSPFNLGLQRPPAAFENGPSEGVFVHALSNGVPELGGWFDRPDDPTLTYFRPDDTTSGMDCKVITTTTPPTLGVDCLLDPDVPAVGEIMRGPTSGLGIQLAAAHAFFASLPALQQLSLLELRLFLGDEDAYVLIQQLRMAQAKCRETQNTGCGDGSQTAATGDSLSVAAEVAADAPVRSGRYRVTAVARNGTDVQDLRFFTLWFGHDAARAWLDPDGLGYQSVLGVSIDRVCATGYDFTATYHGSDPSMVLDVTVTDTQTEQQQVLTVGGVNRHEHRQGCP